MATMITDGGFVIGLPYVLPDSPYISAMGTPAGDTKWFQVTGSTLTPEDVPPLYDCKQQFYDLTLDDWSNLAAFKLYIRRMPEDPDAPPVPIFEPTNDRLVFQVQAWKRDATINIGGLKEEYSTTFRTRWVIFRAEGPTNIVQDGPGETSAYVKVWNDAGSWTGRGCNESGVYAVYQSGLLDDGTIDPNNHELLAIMFPNIYGAYTTSGGYVEYGQRHSGFGLDLTALGYSLYFLEGEENPYADPDEDDDGFSGPGGGGGDHDKTSDLIEIPPDPTITATDCGFVTLYNPNLAQINALAAQINSETFYQTLKNFFEHAQDYIAGLAIIPVQPTVGGAVHPKMGWFTLDVAMPPITQQYVTVSCGSIDVKEFYGSSFDYAPATQLQLFLPYCGYIELNVDEVMGQTLGVTYKVDVYNGNCVAFVTVNNSVIGQYNGNCMQQIPVSSITFDDVIRNSITLAASAASGLVSAGAGALGIAAGLGANQSGQSKTDQINLETKMGQGAASLGSGLLEVMTTKPRVERSGSLGSSIGLMGVQKPYLIKIVPRQSLPRSYSRLAGYPSNITARLSECSGYVQIDKINLAGIPGTLDELNEITQILNGGIII